MTNAHDLSSLSSHTVIVFGGSFNPPTDHHLRAAKQLRAALPGADVWLMVSPQNPFKEKQGMAPFAKRLAMTALLVKGEPHLRATGIERVLGTTETAATLKALCVRFPATRFVWAMGADNLVSFHSWGDSAFLLNEVPIFLLPRKGYAEAALASPSAKTPRLAEAKEALFANGLFFLPGEGESGSATLARESMKTNGTMPGVPERVRAYVRSRGLYL